MNVAKLEAEFLKNPDPSTTVLKGIARANGMDVLEIVQWFQTRRQTPKAMDPPAEDLEVHDLVQEPNVPGPSEARGVRRAREGSDHQEQDQLPIKRPAVVDPAIQKMNEKLDLYLHSPKNQDFFLGVLKLIGPEASDAEINGAAEFIGVDPQVIKHWKKKLEEKGLLQLPVPPVQPPVFDRTQPPTHQPRTQEDGVEKEEGEEGGRGGIQVADRREQRDIDEERYRRVLYENEELQARYHMLRMELREQNRRLEDELHMMQAQFYVVRHELDDRNQEIRMLQEELDADRRRNAPGGQ